MDKISVPIIISNGVGELTLITPPEVSIINAKAKLNHLLIDYSLESTTNANQ